MIDIFVVPDIWNVLAQLGATLVLFLVIRHFLYKPMNEFLEKRKEKVMSDLNEADTKKKEALALKSEYEEELSKAQQEAQEIIEESRKRGAMLEKEQVEEAKEKSQAILNKARLQIDSEKQMAREEVRKEVGDLAVLMAEKILNDTINEKKQAELVDGFIKDLEQNHVH